MSEPVHIAAIDAGSNAVRLSVARAYSALDIEPLYNERYSLRLGEGVFVRHRFSDELFKKGVKAFRHFREIMDEHGVTRYRAVATSASREARVSGSEIERFGQKRQAKEKEVIRTDRLEGRTCIMPARIVRVHGGGNGRGRGKPGGSSRL